MNSLADILTEKPKYMRAGKSTGAVPYVEREGGNQNAGLIRSVSVATAGEALGHSAWLDAVFLDQVTDSINSTARGIKSRFAHPGLSGDGIGSFLGRVKNASLVDDQIIADLHLSASSHDTPDGNLASYVMDLAEEDPEAFGLSIVFEEDQSAMETFRELHTRDREFTSPDLNNKNNFPHLRLEDLRAADAVDEPAANPSGLFRRGQAVAVDADALASYALGLSSLRPSTKALGIDADRARGFVARFLSTNNLEVRQMTDPTPEVTITSPAIDQDVTVEATETEDIQPTEEVQNTPAVVASDGRSEARRFVEAFGDIGAVWYAEGLTFEEARTRETQELREQVDRLKTQLAMFTDGEQEPIELTPGEVSTRKGFAGKLNIAGA